MGFHCTQPCIITLSLSRYDSDTVGKDIQSNGKSSIHHKISPYIMGQVKEMVHNTSLNDNSSSRTMTIFSSLLHYSERSGGSVGGGGGGIKMGLFLFYSIQS